MKYIIDTDQNKFSIDQNGQMETMDLYSKRAFEILSQKWLKLGWNQKYSYTFTWFGRPIIQFPEDLLRMQEVIYQVKPEVIVETGIAHGGSLIFYASLCKILGKGRVIGIDIKIKRENREEIEAHPLSSYITLIEGSSIDYEISLKVKNSVLPCEKVMVILDSNHSKKHVENELEIYHSLVTNGSYIVATDGIMKDLYNVPQGGKDWDMDNPAAAAIEFAEKHPEFELSTPKWSFNESKLTQNITYWPSAWLRKK